MKSFKTLFFITFFNLNCNVITFFVNEYGYKLEPVNQPFYGITKKIVKKSINKNRIPIFSTYAGYLATTNEIGQIVFPRETTTKSFNVVITNKIKPIFMFPYTVSHWEIEKNAEAKMYLISRKKEDHEYYWNIEKKPIPKNRKIDDLAIIIFAKPKNIVYELDKKFKANLGAQVLLPPIYVKPKYQPAQNAIFTINIIKLFKKVFYRSKENQDAYSFNLKK